MDSGEENKKEDEVNETPESNKVPEKNINSTNQSAPEKPHWFKRAAKATGKKLWSSTKKVGSHLANPGEGVSNFFLILAFLIHVIDGFLNFNVLPFRFAAYGFLFLFGWFFVFKEKGSDVLSKQSGFAAFISFGLAFLAFIIPFFLFKWLDPIMDYNLINVLVVCFPIYFIYFVIRPTTPLMKGIQTVVIIAWIILFVFYFFVAVKFSNDDSIQFLKGVTAKFMIGESEANAGGAWGDLLRFITGTIGNFISEFWKTVTQAGNRTVAFGESRLEYATGGYYSGEEENAPAQGVFIKNIIPSQPEYMENDIIEISAMVDIQTPSDYIDMQIVCEAQEDGLGEEIITPGVILEGEYMRGYKDEFLPVTCAFKDGLKKGSQNVIFKVSYEYETSSSLKVYFMDKERRDAMRAEGIDPIQEYGKENNPQSISTKGPVKLGIKQPPLPIALDSNNNNGPLIGFTLDNDWGGEINEVKNIYVYTPNGMDLDIENYCVQFEKYSSTENEMNVYILNNPAEIGHIEDYLTINCKTIITERDSLLGQDELSTKQIKVTAEYIFQTEETFDLRVE